MTANTTAFDLTTVLTKWPIPVAAVIIVVAISFMLIFRRPLTEFIGRVLHVRAPGTHIDATGQKAPQPGPTETLLKAEGGEAPVAKKDPRTAADELLRLVPHGEYYTFLERRLIQSFGGLGITGDPAQAARVLFYIAGVLGASVEFERHYDTIFGSQIRILQTLNATPLPLVKLRPYYAEATARYPLTFTDYSFEQYVSYLRNAGLVEVKEEQVSITVKGRTFLTYLASEGKALNRAG